MTTDPMITAIPRMWTACEIGGEPGDVAEEIDGCLTRPASRQ